MSIVEEPRVAEGAVEPRSRHRFTFGLWTVGNPGRDPFGGPTREPIDPVDSVYKLAELGAWGVSLHDDDLIPWGVSAAERRQIVDRFKAALESTGSTSARVGPPNGSRPGLPTVHRPNVKRWPVRPAWTPSVRGSSIVDNRFSSCLICLTAKLISGRRREVKVRGVGDLIRPARRDHLAACVEPHALGSVDVVIAEQ